MFNSERRSFGRFSDNGQGHTQLILEVSERKKKEEEVLAVTTAIQLNIRLKKTPFHSLLPQLISRTCNLQSLIKPGATFMSMGGFLKM